MDELEQKKVKICTTSFNNMTKALSTHINDLKLNDFSKCDCMQCKSEKICFLSFFKKGNGFRFWENETKKCSHPFICVSELVISSECKQVKTFTEKIVEVQKQYFEKNVCDISSSDK